MDAASREEMKKERGRIVLRSRVVVKERSEFGVLLTWRRSAYPSVEYPIPEAGLGPR